MKVLKFGAMWCSGCLVMKPIWAEIEKENSWVKARYFDIDEKPKIAQKHKIDDRIPVFIFLDKQDKEILRLVGQRSKDALLEILNKYKSK